MGRGSKRRRSGFRIPKRYRYAIFSEGLVTEPAYFRGMRHAVEKNAIYREMIYIEGAGCDTLRVLDCAQEWVEKNQVTDCHVWCLYDKDDFPESDFNTVGRKIESLNAKSKNGVYYHAGWSNECFEYWLVLHCRDYVSQNGREDYERVLNDEFKKRLGKSYSKSERDCFGKTDKSLQPLYEDILQIGNPKDAIRRADRQVKSLKEMYGENIINKTPSKAVPATMVHELVKELANYLEPAVKKRFI